MRPIVRRSVAVTSACALVLGIFGWGMSGAAIAAGDKFADSHHANLATVAGQHENDEINHDDPAPEHHGAHSETVGDVYWAAQDWIPWESPQAGEAPEVTEHSLRVQDTTIVHRLRVVYMRPAGSTLGNENQVRSFFQTVSDHWSDQTNGAIRFEVQDFRFMDDPNGQGCKNTSDISSKFWDAGTAAMWPNGQQPG